MIKFVIKVRCHPRTWFFLSLAAAILVNWPG